MKAPFRIARFYPGFSSNSTILTLPTLTGCEVFVDNPSHKAVHVKKLGIVSGKGAGNDWSPKFTRSETESFIRACQAVGKMAYEQFGLVGMWGIEGIWNNGEFVVNEINCRLERDCLASRASLIAVWSRRSALNCLAVVSGDNG